MSKSILHLIFEQSAEPIKLKIQITNNEGIILNDPFVIGYKCITGILKAYNFSIISRTSSCPEAKRFASSGSSAYNSVVNSPMCAFSSSRMSAMTFFANSLSVA